MNQPTIGKRTSMMLPLIPPNLAMLNLHVWSRWIITIISIISAAACTRCHPSPWKKLSEISWEYLRGDHGRYIYMYIYIYINKNRKMPREKCVSRPFDDTINLSLGISRCEHAVQVRCNFADVPQAFQKGTFLEVSEKGVPPNHPV